MGKYDESRYFVFFSRFNFFSGRRNTFHVYTLGAIPIFGGLPYLINQCVTDPTGPLAPMYLAAFCGSTVAAISIMGGVFAVLPAYEVGILKSRLSP